MSCKNEIKPLPYAFCEGCYLNGCYPWNRNPIILCSLMGGYNINIITQDENGTVVCSGYKIVDEETWKTHLNNLKQGAEHNELCRRRARNGKLMSTELLPAEYIQQKTLVGTEIENMSWTQFDLACRHIVKETKEHGMEFSKVYGIPRGGTIPAVHITYLLNQLSTNKKTKHIFNISEIDKYTLILDEITDTGITLNNLTKHVQKRLRTIHCHTATLVYNPHSIFTPDIWVYKKGPDWVNFPWEGKVNET